MSKITIDEQIAEIAREIALRENVYRSRVARQQMDQADADLHMARILAVMETLKWIKANRERLVA